MSEPPSDQLSWVKIQVESKGLLHCVVPKIGNDTNGVVIDEPVEVQDLMRITHLFRGIWRINLKWIKGN